MTRRTNRRTTRTQRQAGSDAVAMLAVSLIGAGMAVVFWYCAHIVDLAGYSPANEGAIGSLYTLAILATLAAVIVLTFAAEAAFRRFAA